MPKTSAVPPARVAFQYPNFRNWMTARFLSVTASEMQAIAVAWQVYGITHRPLDLGLVGLAQFLPGILLFLVAGQAADRFPRQRIMELCFAGSAVSSLLLLALTLRGLSSVYPIYAVLLMTGTVRAFSGPTGQAFLPQLVPPEHFPNAVAWGSSIFQSAQILGPMIGGLVYSWRGNPVPVYIWSAAQNVVALALIARLQVRVPARKGGPSADMVLDGLRYIGRNKIVLGAISLDLFAVLLGGAVALLPVYAREILHIGAAGLGLLRSAPGIGAVVMAVALAHRPLRERPGRTMLQCVFGFGICTIVFGYSRNFLLSLLSLILLGAFDMVSVIVRHTLIQLSTPDEMRGRVSSVNMVFIGASNEVGQFESGLTAQWFGTVPAVVLGGIGSIVVVLLWAWLFPMLREVREMPQRQEV